MARDTTQKKKRLMCCQGKLRLLKKKQILVLNVIYSNDEYFHLIKCLCNFNI